MGGTIFRRAELESHTTHTTHHHSDSVFILNWQAVTQEDCRPRQWVLHQLDMQDMQDMKVVV